MAVVGAQRDFRVGAPFAAAAALLGEQRAGMSKRSARPVEGSRYLKSLRVQSTAGMKLQQTVVTPISASAARLSFQASMSRRGGVHIIE